MTAVLSAGRPRALALGRPAAALTGASAVAHVLQATTGSLAALVMAAMAVACGPCAWHLWRSPTASAWRLTALLDVTMLVLHVQPAAAAGHVHDGSSAGGLMWTGLALVTASLALSAVALTRGDRAGSARPR